MLVVAEISIGFQNRRDPQSGCTEVAKLLQLSSQSHPVVLDEPDLDESALDKSVLPGLI